MKKWLSVIAAAALASSAFLTVGGAADAATPKTYKSCKEMNDGKYPHGVGKSGAVDTTSGKKVRNFKVDNAAYKRHSTSASLGSQYRDLDRDNDGIACERI